MLRHVALAALLLVSTPLAMTAQSPVRRINPPTLSTPTGYTHVTVGTDGRTVHIAGQVSADRAGQVVGVGDFRAQVEQVVALARPEYLIEIEAVAMLRSALR